MGLLDQLTGRGGGGVERPSGAGLKRLADAILLAGQGPDIGREQDHEKVVNSLYKKELLVLQKDRRYSQTRDSLLQIYDAAQGELLNYHPAARVAVRIVHTSPGSAEAAEAVQRLRSTPLLDLYNLAASECVLDSMLSAAAGPVIADLQEGRFQGVGGALQRRVQQHLACSDPLDAVHVVHFMHGHSGVMNLQKCWREVHDAVNKYKVQLLEPRNAPAVAQGVRTMISGAGAIKALDLFAPHIKAQLQGINSLTKMVAGEKSLTRRGARLLGNLLRKLNLLFALDEYDELRGKRNAELGRLLEDLADDFRTAFHLILGGAEPTAKVVAEGVRGLTAAMPIVIEKLEAQAEQQGGAVHKAAAAQAAADEAKKEAADAKTAAEAGAAAAKAAAEAGAAQAVELAQAAGAQAMAAADAAGAQAISLAQAGVQAAVDTAVKSALAQHGFVARMQAAEDKAGGSVRRQLHADAENVAPEAAADALSALELNIHALRTTMGRQP